MTSYCCRFGGAVSEYERSLIAKRMRRGRQAKFRLAKRNNKSNDYLLRALMSCGGCHASCIARTSRRGYRYYLCRAKLPAIKSCRDEKCTSRFIPAQQLDEIVWQDLCDVVTHPELIAVALQRAQAGTWLPQELQARREQLRKAQGHLN